MTHLKHGQLFFRKSEHAKKLKNQSLRMNETKLLEGNNDKAFKAIKLFFRANIINLL